MAQPLFEVLADSPEFFVARGNGATDIVVLAFALVLVPPTLLLAIEVLASALGSAARSTVHLVFVAGLGAASALRLLEAAVGDHGVALVPVAIALGVVGSLLYERADFVRSMLTVLSPVPAVFLALFLLVSPVSDLVLPSGGSRAEAGVASRAGPVVMLVFDELSVASLMDARHRIDRARYPNLAALSDDATWYRNATTVADLTPRAVPALVTGIHPEEGRLPVASDYPRSLFTMLGERYGFEVTEPITDICPERLCGSERRPSLGARLRSLASDLSVVSLHGLLPEDLRRGLPAVDRSFEDFRNEGSAAELIRWVRGNPNRDAVGLRARQFEHFLRQIGPEPDRPTLHFLHVLLPHIPWEYLPSGQRYPAERNPPGLEDRWTEQEEPVRQAYQRYLLQLVYTDRLVGRLLDRLREAGLYDRSLVVVTADHGVSFDPGGYRRYVTRSNVGAIAGVPLLVKGPRQRRGETDDSGARTIDVLPTIADHLGISLPWRLDGRSLLRVRPPLRSVQVAHDGGPVNLSLTSYRRHRNAEVDRMLNLFKPGIPGLYARPGDELVGRRVDELPVRRASTPSVEIDDADVLRHTSPTRRIVPAFLTGSISGNGSATRRLAVAVNGRVRAVTESYPDGDRTRFSCLVDPRGFRSGENTVEVLSVGGSGSEILLTRLGGIEPVGSAARYRLIERMGDVVIRRSSGSPLTVGSDAAGFVEGIAVEGDELILSGWSATERGPAREVIAFRHGRFLGAARTSLSRPDVADGLGRRARRSGFRMVTSIGAAPNGREASTRGIRVFGVFGDRAFGLRRAGSL